MENIKKDKFNNLAFYFLMGIIGLSVVYVLGYLLYTAIYG